MFYYIKQIKKFFGKGIIAERRDFELYHSIILPAYDYYTLPIHSLNANFHTFSFLISFILAWIEN